MRNKILIAGGTGRTGRIIVRKLVANGFSPHLLVRDLSKARDLVAEEVILHRADVRDIDTLLEPMQGVEVLISAVGTCAPVGQNCPKRVDHQGVANLVTAAQRTGVKRFILISSIAVTHPDHPLNRFGRILDWKRKGEDALRQSGLEYAIIRPGGLTDTSNGSQALTFAQGDQIMGTLSRENLAEICLQAFAYSFPLRVTFEAIELDQKGPLDWPGLFAALTPD